MKFKCRFYWKAATALSFLYLLSVTALALQYELWFKETAWPEDLEYSLAAHLQRKSDHPWFKRVLTGIRLSWFTNQIQHQQGPTLSSGRSVPEGTPSLLPALQGPGNSFLHLAWLWFYILSPGGSDTELGLKTTVTTHSVYNILGDARGLENLGNTDQF